MSKKKKVAAAIIAVTAISGLSLFITFAIVPILANNEYLLQWITDLGPLGPIAYIVIETIQSLIPIWSGQPFEVLGGAVFGWWAILYTTISSIIAHAIAFLAVRRLGRPFVSKLVGEKNLEQFDFILKSHNGFPLFICSLVPFFPDDVVVYGSGLTKFTFRRYMIIVIFSVPLAATINTAIGVGIGTANLILVGAIAGTTLLLTFLFYAKREKIFGLLRKISKTEP